LENFVTEALALSSNAGDVPPRSDLLTTKLIHSFSSRPWPGLAKWAAGGLALFGRSGQFWNYNTLFGIHLELAKVKN
jgi:hypothetical protein